jgi:hypothetical protein
MMLAEVLVMSEMLAQVLVLVMMEMMVDGGWKWRRRGRAPEGGRLGVLPDLHLLLLVTHQRLLTTVVKQLLLL